MNIQLPHVLGTWRHTNGNILIDFNIRHSNQGDNITRAMFTIYQRGPESKIHYEWHGTVEIVNFENDISKIIITDINRSEEKSEYENLKIWSIEPYEMFLELGNGDKILFRKLGNIFS